jgi:3-hydroxybutyryl-CoA dehydrogenase
MTSAVEDRHTSASLPATASDVRNVLVVGAGQMGSGIAQVFAQGGRKVWLSDVSLTQLDRAKAGIARSAGKLSEKGRISDEQRGWVEGNITYVEGLDTTPGHEIQLAVEAATENLDLKLELLHKLDTVLGPDAVLASNTSSISITKLGAHTSRAPHVVGMHFMNPPPMLPLVEVITGLQTLPAVADLVEGLARDLGKVPVRSADSPGFITNRVLMPMLNEAFFCLQENVGTAEGIDEAMKLGMAHPMGPLALADLIGLDTTLAILEVLHGELGDDKYRPCPLLRRYVDAGRLGRKSGSGVYEY